MRKVEKEIYEFDKHQLVGKVDSNFFGKLIVKQNHFNLERYLFANSLKDEQLLTIKNEVNMIGM